MVVMAVFAQPVEGLSMVLDGVDFMVLGHALEIAVDGGDADSLPALAQVGENRLCRREGVRAFKLFGNQRPWTCHSSGGRHGQLPTVRKPSAWRDARQTVDRSLLIVITIIITIYHVG